MLEDLLRRERATIVRKWFDRVLDTYHEDTARFLNREKDPFANPVGSAIRQGIDGLFDGLLQNASSKNLIPHLDRIVRIRAVQDFSPSATIGLIFCLKDTVRKVLKKEIVEKDLHEEVRALESRIDHVALLAFDIYMRCREEICELRVKELRGHRDAAVRMLQRSGRLFDDARDGEKP